MTATVGPRDSAARLVTGGGRFVADMSPDHMAQGVFVRAMVPHGRIRSIDAAAALKMPGVHAILTGEDLRHDGFGTIPTTRDVIGRDGEPHHLPPRYGLAVDRVRHVGEPICLVVAETRAQAQDAAEAVAVDIEPLPHVTDAVEADADDAPLVWDDAPGNLCLDWELGDAAMVEARFKQADHVVRLAFRNSRVAPSPLEPRGAVADFQDGRYTLRAATQGVFSVRRVLAESVLKVPLEAVRVVTGDVGGAFGMKTPVYPEYVALLAAAGRLGRPVGWVADRSEGFLSDNHGRDSAIQAEMALDGAGHICAVRVSTRANMGAYLAHVGPFIQTVRTASSLASVYRTPAIHMRVKCLFTNTSPVGPYRGAGRPEANVIMERLIDLAAAETGRDRIELRRRNLIAASQIPYRTPTGLLYDSGRFGEALEKALERADWNGFAERRAESARRGRIRGIGVGCYLEATGGAPQEEAVIQFAADGSVTVALGTQSLGQRHAETFAKVFADRLGYPVDKVTVLEGDSDRPGSGGGSVGSRSATAAGTAIVVACDAILERARDLASEALEAAPADLTFAAGGWAVAGTDRGIAMTELAARFPGELSVSETVNYVPTFPNGCHICEVEIDRETGAVELVRYTAVDDVGTVLNAPVVDGQVHGGIAQAVGQVLMEQALYQDGQLVTGSFLDYAMPRADDLPNFDLAHHVVPAATNPLGVKGAGEGGTTGALPTVLNAVHDALRSVGAPMVDMPTTSERVWRALQQAEGGESP